MFDFFDLKKHKDVIKSLATLTAQIDDTQGIGSPFTKMTRSPNHMVAWFLIYAAAESTQLDTLLEKLKSLAHQHKILAIARQEIGDLKQSMHELIQHPDMIKVLSYLADKVRIELDVDPSQYLVKVRENGYLALAEFLNSREIIKFNAEANGIRITTTVDQSVQWHKSFSDSTPGLLSLTKESLDRGNLKFFAYHPKTGEFCQITAGEKLIELAKVGFSVTGDLRDFEQINLHIPLPGGKSELAIDIPPSEINPGLYRLFNGTRIANIRVADIKVFIQGTSRLDKDGASASQTQAVMMFRSSTPSIHLTFAQQPTALFFDALIAANFEPEPKPHSTDSPILLVEVRTKTGGTLLLSPVHLNSIAALELMYLGKQKHPMTIYRQHYQEAAARSAQPEYKAPIKTQDEDRSTIREYLSTQMLPQLQEKDKAFDGIDHVRLSNFVVKSGRDESSLKEQDLFLVCKSEDAFRALEEYLPQICFDLTFDFDGVNPVHTMYWGKGSRSEDQYLIGIKNKDISRFFEYFKISADFVELLKHALPWYTNYLKYQELYSKIADVMLPFDIDPSNNDCFEYAMLRYFGLAIKPSCGYSFDKNTANLSMRLSINAETCQALLDSCAMHSPDVCTQSFAKFSAKKDMKEFLISIQFLLDKWEEIKNLLEQEILLYTLNRREDSDRKNIEQAESKDKDKLWRLNSELFGLTMRSFNKEFIETAFKINGRLILSVEFCSSSRSMEIHTVTIEAAQALEKTMRFKLESKFNEKYWHQIRSQNFSKPMIIIDSGVLKKLLPLIPALQEGTTNFDIPPGSKPPALSSRDSSEPTLSKGDISADTLSKLFGFESKLVLYFTEDPCSFNALIINTLNIADARLIADCIRKGLEKNFKTSYGGHIKVGNIAYDDKPMVRISFSALEHLKTLVSTGITVPSPSFAEQPATLFSMPSNHHRLLASVKSCLSTPDAHSESILSEIQKGKYSLALRKACANNKLEVIKLIIQYKDRLKIDINEPSSNGNTALDWLHASTPHIEKEAIKKLLIESGAINKAMSKTLVH